MSAASIWAIVIVSIVVVGFIFGQAKGWIPKGFLRALFAALIAAIFRRRDNDDTDPPPDPDDEEDEDERIPLPPPKSGVWIVIAHESADRHKDAVKRFIMSRILVEECGKAGVGLHFVDKDGKGPGGNPSSFAPWISRIYAVTSLPGVVLVRENGVNQVYALPKTVKSLLLLTKEFIERGNQ